MAPTSRKSSMKPHTSGDHFELELLCEDPVALLEPEPPAGPQPVVLTTGLEEHLGIGTDPELPALVCHLRPGLAEHVVLRAAPEREGVLVCGRPVLQHHHLIFALSS